MRAQEMLFASHQVEDFRNRKAKDKHQLLNHLKVLSSAAGAHSLLLSCNLLSNTCTVSDTSFT